MRRGLVERTQSVMKWVPRALAWTAAPAHWARASWAYAWRAANAAAACSRAAVRSNEAKSIVSSAVAVAPAAAPFPPRALAAEAASVLATSPGWPSQKAARMVIKIAVAAPRIALRVV